MFGIVYYNVQVIKIIASIFILSIVSVFRSSAQNSSSNIRGTIDTMIISKINYSQFKDTTVTYAFAFKLHVVRKGIRTEVVSITANDSLAYELIPSYKSLSRIDYSNIGKGRKKFSLIIPIYIGTYGSKHHDFDEADYLKNPMDVFNKLFYAIQDTNNHTYNMQGFKRYIFPKSEELIYMYPFQLILDLKVYE